MNVDAHFLRENMIDAGGIFDVRPNFAENDRLTVSYLKLKHSSIWQDTVKATTKHLVFFVDIVLLQTF